MRIETRQQRHSCMTELLCGLASGQLNPSDLRAISGEIGFSFDHVNRLCLELTSESIGSFYRRIRLESAAKSLKSGMDIGTASILAQFGTTEGFSKAFRRAYGMSPSEFIEADPDWRIDSGSTIHFGDQKLFPLLTEAGQFGAYFEVRQPLELYAREHIGDFARIPSAWAALGKELTPDARESNDWITIYQSDGKVDTNREAMKAQLAYLVVPGIPILSGFQPSYLPGGAYVVTGPLSDPGQHRDAWWFINRTWVPDRKAQTNHLPGYDQYDSFPDPWPSRSVQIALRLAAYRLPS